MSPHCTGPCDQGRKRCPAPDACELKESDDRQIVFVAAAVAVVTLIVLITLVCA